MARRVILAALGLLYAATAILVVRSLGETYRLALREQRATLALVSARKAPVVEPTEERLAPVARSEPEPSAVPVAPPVHPKDHKSKKATSHPATHLAHAVPKARPAPVPYTSPVKLRPLVVAGLMNATAHDEELFGDTLNKLILINHPAVDDGGPQQRTLIEASQPMLDLRERKDIEVKIVVLDADEVNAFSHIGGFIYVTRGLLNFAGTDEEFHFVVGHELAHIDLRHGRELVAARTLDGTIEKVGTLQAMYHQVAAGYTEAEEFAADDWVIDRMLKLDHTSRECLMYLRKLRRLSEELNFREGSKPPRSLPEATVQDVENHIRAQPAAWKRLARLETRLNATPARPGSIGPPGTGP